MDSEFERKLRAAASAGWRVLAVEVAGVALVWLAYVALISTHSAFLLALMGPDVSWSTVATISLQAIAAYKVVLWVQAGLLAWVSLWAAALRKHRAEAAQPRTRPPGEEEPKAASPPVSARA